MLMCILQSITENGITSCTVYRSNGLNVVCVRMLL